MTGIWPAVHSDVFTDEDFLPSAVSCLLLCLAFCCVLPSAVSCLLLYLAFCCVLPSAVSCLLLCLAVHVKIVSWNAVIEVSTSNSFVNTHSSTPDWNAGPSTLATNEHHLSPVDVRPFPKERYEKNRQQKIQSQCYFSRYSSKDCIGTGSK